MSAQPSTSRAPLSHPIQQSPHDDDDDDDELSDGDGGRADGLDDEDENEDDSHPFLPETSESITPFKIPEYSQCPWTERIEGSEVDGWIARRFEEGTWNKHTTRTPKDQDRDPTEEPVATKKGPPKRFLSVIEYRCTWSGKPRTRDAVPRKTLLRRARKPSTKVGCKAKFFVKETVGSESREVTYHWQHTGHDPTSLTQVLRARPSQLPPSLRAIRPNTRKSQYPPAPPDDRSPSGPAVPSIAITPGCVPQAPGDPSSPITASLNFHQPALPLLSLADERHVQSLSLGSRSPQPPTKRRRIDGSEEDVFYGDEFIPAPHYEQRDGDSNPNGRNVAIRNHHGESRTTDGIINEDQEEFVPMEEAETPMDTTPFLPTFTPVRGSRGSQHIGGSVQGLPVIQFLTRLGPPQPPTFARSLPIPQPIPPHSDSTTVSPHPQTPSILDTQDTLSLLRTIRQSHESSGKMLELLTHRLIQEGSSLDDGRLKEVMRRAAGSALGYGGAMREWAMEEGV